MTGFRLAGGWWFLLGGLAMSWLWTFTYRVTVDRCWFDLMERG